MANKFILKGHDLEISYAATSNPNLPALSYRRGSFSQSFLPSQIHTDDTTLGQFVTVTLEPNVDSGAITFSFFLPTLDVPSGDLRDFSTVGLYREVRGPVILPKRQTTEWRNVHLYGVAQTVIAPAERAKQAV